MRLRTANNNRRRYDRRKLLRERFIIGPNRWSGRFRRQMQKHVRQMNRDYEKRMLNGGHDVPFIREMITDPAVKVAVKPPEASRIPDDFGPAVGGPMHARFLEVNRRYRK